MTGRVVHFVVPDGLDDPARPSGGNRYDRRVMDGLRDRGWTVTANQQGWSREMTTMARSDALVVVDGLVGLEEPDRHRGRVVLLHMPFAASRPELHAAEHSLLQGAAAVVTTSAWARDWVVAHHDLDPDLVSVARPGIDPAPVAAATPEGRRLLCVAAITPGKGHDVLLDALGRVADLDWTCTCAGALDLAPDHVARLRAHDIAARVRFAGPLGDADLDGVLADTDLLVSPSRHESYGMAVTEALARSIPVLVTDVGGHREAAGDEQLLVPPDDPAALADALRRWLTDPDSRVQLREAAARRRTDLRSWDDTTDDLEAVLNHLVAGPV